MAAILPARAGVTPRSHLRALAGTGCWPWIAHRFADRLSSASGVADGATPSVGRCTRLIVSHRASRCEWVTAAQASLAATLRLRRIYRKMIGGVAGTLVAAPSLSTSSGGNMVDCDAVPVLWILTARSRCASAAQPAWRDRPDGIDADARALRLVARRTWRFFETFVTAEDQHAAARQLSGGSRAGAGASHLAHHTSASTCCRSSAPGTFGWIGTTRRGERLRATLQHHESLAALSRPLLQLVRHLRDLASIGAALRIIRSTAGNLARTPHHCQRARSASGATLLRCRVLALRVLATPATWRARRCERLPAELRTPSNLLGATAKNSSRIIEPRRCLDVETMRGDITVPPRTLQLHAYTLVDIARTLASDGGDEAHGDILFWSDAIHRCVESWRGRPLASDDTTLKERLLTLETTAAIDGRSDGVRLPARSAAQLLSDRLSRRRRHARPELLRPARLGGPPRELRRDRQGRHPVAPLVPARAHRDAGRSAARR